MKRLKHKAAAAWNQRRSKEKRWVCSGSHRVFDGPVATKRKCPNPNCARFFDTWVCPKHWFEPFTAPATPAPPPARSP